MGTEFTTNTSGYEWLDRHPGWLDGARVTVSETDQDDEGRLTTQYSEYPNVRVNIDGAWLHVDRGEPTVPGRHRRYVSYPAHVVSAVEFVEPE